MSPPRRKCAHCAILQVDEADWWYWVRTPAAAYVDLCSWSCLRAWVEGIVS